MAIQTTRELGKFVANLSFSDIPARTVEYTKCFLLKTVAGMVLGSREPFSKQVAAYLRSVGGRRQAGVVCAGFRTTVENAAFAVGVSSHASELEDDQFPGSVGTFWVWPAIFPLAEKLKSSGEDVILSASAGWEVTARLGIAGDPATGMRGYGPCPFYGIIGTAACAAKLLKLNAEQTVNAMSLATSLSSGLIHQAGTDAHFIESGHTCRMGVVCALLARDGATGQPDILERKAGLLDLADVPPDTRPKITENLGKPPFQVHGIWIKKYPCCFVMHTSIDALRMLMKEHNIKNEHVEKVQTEVTQHAYDLANRQPKTLGDARFSFYHALGEVLLKGTVDINTFTRPEKLTDPALEAARKKISVILRQDWPLAKAKRARVTVFFKDGHKLEKELYEIIGGPQAPLTAEQFIELYRTYTTGIINKTIQRRIADMVMYLEKQKDIVELMDILTYAAEA